MGLLDSMRAWGTTPRILSCNSFSKPFITDITIIRLETPILKPITASNDVKDNAPPLLDLKYLNASFKGRENTRFYFKRDFNSFSMLPLYGGLTPSNNLSNLKPTSLKIALWFEKFLKPS